MRPDWQTYFMDLAYAVSKRASCPRRSVGCVLTRDAYVLSIGYNGSPRGMEHCLTAGCLMMEGSCKRAVHAEMNAITAAAHTGTSIKGATAYVTTRPCFDCARSLVNAGVHLVYYTEDYPKEWPAKLPLTLVRVEGYVR